MSEDAKLVAGPLSAVGAAVAAIGLARRWPLAVLAGGFAIGYGLKVVLPKS